MLRAMSEGGLQILSGTEAVQTRFLLRRPKTRTRNFPPHLVFGENEYRFTLGSTVGSEVTVKSEDTYWTGAGGWGQPRRWSGGVPS